MPIHNANLATISGHESRNCRFLVMLERDTANAWCESWSCNSPNLMTANLNLSS